MAHAFSRTEQEVIILKSVWELIDEMVNYEIFGKLTKTDEVTLWFNTITHKRLFNILLVDFLSQPSRWPFDLPLPPAGARASDRSMLFHLRRVCDGPCLNPGGAVALRAELDSLVDCLEGECCVEKVWLPSIDVETTIHVQRITFIKICGNIAKHGFARLSANVGDICEILRTNGRAIELEQGYLALPEFYEWFHRNIFSYHSSTIAEFLNNLRWAIYDYLRPEFMRSFTKDDPSSIAYRFVYPRDCTRPIAQAIYWELMNQVRAAPYVPRFTVTPSITEIGERC
jgi:hypothetical protein